MSIDSHIAPAWLYCVGADRHSLCADAHTTAALSSYPSLTCSGTAPPIFTVSVEDAYRWDPATVVPGVRSQNVLGVEAPLWTETIASRADMDYMLFPRLIGIAEIGWSPKAGRSWNEYRRRLGAQAERPVALGIDFYRAPEVQWR